MKKVKTIFQNESLNMGCLHVRNNFFTTMKYIDGIHIDTHTGLRIYAMRKQAYSKACNCF